MRISKERQIEIDNKITDMLIEIDMSCPENTVLQIVQAKNINVIIDDFAGLENKDSVSGFVYINESGVPTIGIKSTDSPRRKTFSLAHELGHFILGHVTETDGGVVKYRLDTLGYDESDGKIKNEETEANYFAASLLVPENKLTKVLSVTEDFELIARYFGVSEQVINNRVSWLTQNK